MIEESETPGAGSGERGRIGESDFLAERRARRATENGEAALQRRLRETEQERARVAELLEAERAHGSERESELRRVKQREYAEQQLRVEAEGRLSGFEHEG